MKVTLVCIARYYHFDLARELHNYQTLGLFFTGYPQFKLKEQKNFPIENTKSVPLIVTPFMFFDRYKLWPNKLLRSQISFLSHQHLDFVVSKQLKKPTILIAFCGAGLYSGRVNKKMGGIYICDKGSTHIDYQEDLLKEEFLRYQMKYEGTYKKRRNKEILEYEEAEFITVPSNFVLESFVKKGIPREKLVKIPYGAELSRFKYVPNELKIETKTKKNIFNILFVGNFGARKGAIDILKSFKNFKHPNKCLTLIGSIAKEGKILLEKYDISNIRFIGRVRNEELFHYYNEADVFLMPSIEEGFAMVILEALASGCPVITTPNSGGEEIIKNNFNGFIVPIHSPEKIVNCLEAISDSEDLKINLGQNAHKSLKKIGGWAEYGKKWNDFIKFININ